MHYTLGLALLLKREGKILLGKRKRSHGEGTWAPPGGHIDSGESIEQCAKRELLEETGMTLLSYSQGPWASHEYYISLLVNVDQFEGEPQLLEPHKCEGWHWFSEDNLPEPLFFPFASLWKQRLDVLT